MFWNAAPMISDAHDLRSEISLPNESLHGEVLSVARTRMIPYAAHPLPVFHRPGSSKLPYTTCFQAPDDVLRFSR